MISHKRPADKEVPLARSAVDRVASTGSEGVPRMLPAAVAKGLARGRRAARERDPATAPGEQPGDLQWLLYQARADAAKAERELGVKFTHGPRASGGRSGGCSSTPGTSSSAEALEAAGYAVEVSQRSSGPVVIPWQSNSDNAAPAHLEAQLGLGPTPRDRQ